MSRLAIHPAWVLFNPILTATSTIHRMNSWSRMKISLDMFQLLCTHVQVIPRFLSLIEGMRKKHFPKDEHFMSCYTHLSTAPENPGTGSAAPLSYSGCQISLNGTYGLIFTHRHLL